MDSFYQLVDRLKARQQPTRKKAVVLAKSAQTQPEPIKIMSTEEALKRLSRACQLGLISGTDAVLIQNGLEASGEVPNGLAEHLRGIT